MASVADANAGDNSGQQTQYLNYSRQDIINMLVSHGLTLTEATTLASVVPQESGGIANALNPNSSTGDYSVGLFQINLYPWNGTTGGANFPTATKLSGGLTGQALLNWLAIPQNNAAVAANLYQQWVGINGNGMQPWAADMSSISKLIANTGWSAVYSPQAGLTNQGTYNDATQPNAEPGALAGTSVSYGLSNLWNFLFGGGLATDVNKGLKFLVGGIIVLLGIIIMLMQIQQVNDTVHDVISTAKDSAVKAGETAAAA